jgi:hypothetical protein
MGKLAQETGLQGALSTSGLGLVRAELSSFKGGSVKTTLTGVGVFFGSKLW